MIVWKRKTRQKPEKLQKSAERLTLQALTWLLVALALAVVPHGFELPVWLMILFAAILGWRWFIALRTRELPSRWVLFLVAVLAGAGVFIDYRTLFGRDAGVALLIAMTACKLLETKALRDGVVLVFLGYLLIMSNLLYSQEIPMISYLFAVVLLMLAAQVMIHRQHAGLRILAPLRVSGGMVLQAIPMMLILFVLFPRIPGPLWGLPQDAYKGRTGLSDEMKPGTVSNLIQSDDVAFRVRFAGPIPPPEQRYWRGPVLSNFDGRSWRPGDAVAKPTLVPFERQGVALTYSVILEPSNRIWLFALDLPDLLPPRAAMTPSFQLLRDQPINEVYRYEMRSYPQYRTGELTATERRRSLQVPSWSNPRTQAMAAEWRSGDARPEALVNKALSLFREQEFYYTLTPPLLGTHSVDEFLFRTHRGFCEHYASAFTFLMRAAGVPARVITGYQGGEHNTVGDYFVIRQSDAHAWSEVWLEGQGWVRVDPTGAVSPARVQEGLYAAVPEGETLPFMARRAGESEWLRQAAMRWDSLNNAWNEWVLAYGPDRQKEFLSGLGFGVVDWSEMTVAMIVTLGGLGLIIVGLRWRKRGPRDPVARAYWQFCTRLARRGLVRSAQEGPLAFTERVATSRPDVAIAARAIGQLYANLRYGPTTSLDQVRQLQQLVRNFRVTRLEAAQKLTQ